LVKFMSECENIAVVDALARALRVDHGLAASSHVLGTMEVAT